MYYPAVDAAKLTVESYDGYEGLYETIDLASLVKGAYIEASNENVKVHDNSALSFLYCVSYLYFLISETLQLTVNSFS